MGDWGLRTIWEKKEKEEQMRNEREEERRKRREQNAKKEIGKNEIDWGKINDWLSLLRKREKRWYI